MKFYFVILALFSFGFNFADDLNENRSATIRDRRLNIERELRQQESLDLPPLNVTYDKDGGLGEVPFFIRHQKSTLLSRFPSLSNVEIIRQDSYRIDQGLTTASHSYELDVPGTDLTKQKVRAFLHDWASKKSRFVTMSFYVVESSLLVGEGKQGADSSTGVEALSTISDAEYAALLKATKRDAQGPMLPRYSITVPHGRSARASMVDVYSYVRGYEEEDPNRPIVDFVEDGLTIQFSPMIEPDGKQVALEIEARSTTVKQPIHQAALMVDGKKDPWAKIEYPEVYSAMRSPQVIDLSDKRMSFRMKNLRVKGRGASENVIEYDILGTVVLSSN